MIHATSAYLMPHPPIIVPAVGRDDLRRCASTSQACAEVAARVAAIAPARLALVSPHAPRLAKAAAVFATLRISGSLARFGAAGARVDLPNDLDLVSRLTAAGRPFGPVEAPLDHGALVPLWYLADAGWSGPTAVVSLPGRADRDELECRSIRVAVDMSRTYVDEALGRLGVETVRHVALGHDKASYLAAPAIDRPQRRGSAVRIDGKQHAGRIRHLAQQGLANRRILV